MSGLQPLFTDPAPRVLGGSLAGPWRVLGGSLAGPWRVLGATRAADRWNKAGTLCGASRWKRRAAPFSPPLLAHFAARAVELVAESAHAAPRAPVRLRRGLPGVHRQPVRLLRELVPALSRGARLVSAAELPGRRDGRERAPSVALNRRQAPWRHDCWLRVRPDVLHLGRCARMCLEHSTKHQLQALAGERVKRGAGIPAPGARAAVRLHGPSGRFARAANV
jgi:hypothetical protein